MATKQGKVGERKSEIIRQVPAACADETTAVEFIERLRWGGEPCCPRCGDTDVAQMRSRQGGRNTRYLWTCHGCRKQFSVRIGTIFEDSRIPLRIWCHAFWRACSSKKGVSSLQIKRETGLSYKSSLFMMHRIRFVMAEDGSDESKLGGIVEADETFVGGKPRYKMRTERGSFGEPVRQTLPDHLIGPEKSPVMALVERGGRVRARTLERVNKDSVAKAIHELVEPSAELHTDEGSHYRWADKPWPGGHETVNHSRREYVRGHVTTNTVEGFFSLIKRGMYGTFHSVSKKHLPRYVSEFEFRYNTRGMDDGARTATAIRRAEGRRLRYRD